MMCDVLSYVWFFLVLALGILEMLWSPLCQFLCGVCFCVVSPIVWSGWAQPLL